VGEAQVGGEEEVAVEDVVMCETKVAVEDDNDEGSYADKLDDSEEERVADDDDGFWMDIQQRVRNIRPDLERWKAMRRNSSIVKSKRDVGEGSFVTNADIGVHDISEEYDIYALDFDVDNDEGVSRDGPKFSKYRADDMTKDFKLKLGMQFSSLKEFKQAIMEHSVLNDKKVQFVKNDQNRVRAVCKKNVVS